MIQNQQKSALKLILKRYWLSILLMLFIANFGVLYVLNMRSKAAGCMTKEELLLPTETRCLYIYNNKVYKKGTKIPDKPHHGHPCGMDVTALLTSSAYRFHIDNMARYLPDNIFIADICSATTPSPTQAPALTNTPFPTRTPTPSTPQLSCFRKIEGDANCDGVISGLDYVIWLYTQCNPEGTQICRDLRADFSNPPDAKVNNVDYQIWFDHSR